MIRKIGAAVVSEDGRLLLVVRKRGRDVFILPGGKPTGDETPEETLHRELEEELGVRPRKLSPLVSVLDQAVFETAQLDMDVYLVTLDGNPSPRGEIEEIAYVGSDYWNSGLRLASGVTHHVLPLLFEDTVRPAHEPVAVLFSGGRDSTAVAYQLHQQGHPLHLLSFTSGLGMDVGLVSLRLAELKTAWGDTFESHKLPIGGLVRDFCFKNLVDDILTDQRQLILLGEALAMVVAAVGFSHAHDLRLIAMGATEYQSHYPEQQRDTLRTFTALCEEYDITFLTPGGTWRSELEVKDRLRLAGLSTKSLEGASLLADLDDRPPPETVADYLRRKLPAARSYLDSLVTSTKGILKTTPR